MIDAKPLRIRFIKIFGFVIVYDVTRYLILLRGERYDFMYNMIRYLIGVKSSITYVVSHNYAKIQFDSFDSLPLEKTLPYNTY